MLSDIHICTYVHILLTRKFNFRRKTLLPPTFPVRLFCYGALSGKMLLVRTLEKNKIDDYLGQLG